MNFAPDHPRDSRQQCGANATADLISLEEIGTNARYQNLTTEGNPIPSLSRGIVPHRADYVNAHASRRSWYDRLHIIKPLAIEWLRNAWGNVDEFGRQVYDTLQSHARRIFVPYDKLDNVVREDQAGTSETSNESYNRIEMKRSAPVILPIQSGNASDETT